MARPTALTPDVQAKVCDAMRIGAYQKEAARFAGVAENTLLSWLKTGRADVADGEDSVHARFVADFEAAEAQAVIRGLTVVQRAAAEGDWRAAMTWMARRHPDRWGERGQVDVRVEHVDPADLELTQLIAEAQAKQAAEEERLRGDGDGP
jgi:hypothetical protein